MMQDFMTMLQGFISNCGFPIAAFLLMWYQNNKTSKSLDALAEQIAVLIEHNKHD